MNLLNRVLIRVAYGDTLRLLGHNPDRLTSSQRRALVVAAEKNGSAWKVFQQTYPAVAAHLKPFEAPAKRRQDQGDFWWELRPCDYYSEFERPKILYADISKRCAFTFDTAKRYSVNTTYFIPSNDLYLLGVLNSSCIETYYAEVSSQVRGGFLRFFTQFVLQLPIPNAPADERTAIAALAQKCLDAKGQGPQVKQWEAEIDERIARLYGLSAADLKAIKGE